MDRRQIIEEIDRIAKAWSEESTDFFGPIPEERIAAAEAELGAAFPASYRVFLSEYGAGTLVGYSISGLSDEPRSASSPPYYDDVVVSTRQLRQGRHGVPDRLVFICSDGGDYFFYLDTSQQRGEECPVVVLGPGADEVVVAESFLDFIRKASRNDLSY